MINKFLNYLVTNFGFDGVRDFNDSLIHIKMMTLTLPLAMISSVIENLLGLQGLTMLAFVILIILELATGLVASKKRGEEIVSHKFGRFGLKVLVWLSLLFVVNSFKKEYSGVEGSFAVLAEGLFTWLHGTLFIYIDLEYLISVLENLGSITENKRNKTLVDRVISKLTKFLSDEKKI
jgi:hypothetical protein